MKRKNLFAVLALALVFTLAFAACGNKDAAETTAETQAVNTDQPLELSDWGLTAETWSSPNGATVHLTATPTYYAEGQTAEFVVRLEGEETERAACDWDGTTYTASVELNAADGYCYYVVLTSSDDGQIEVPINTPTVPTDDALINMASSLESYCNVMVEDSTGADGKLTITGGSVEVQVPRISDGGEPITCGAAVLVLTYNGEEVATAEVTLSETETMGFYKAEIKDVAFDIPAMEDDEQLVLRMDVTLSNDQTLTALGCTWSYIDGQLLSAVG